MGEWELGIRKWGSGEVGEFQLTPQHPNTLTPYHPKTPRNAHAVTTLPPASCLLTPVSYLLNTISCLMIAKITDN